MPTPRSRRIDFTTSAFRSEIPVFETIIRYLGGLVAAYDITGGKKGDYPALLDKAVELAEILMGVFDTPNRMPILYYNWKPAYASQTQRASSSASIAELGSMSMEFTRLAQLTGKIKYYDAVARITDAFEEWQIRGDRPARHLPPDGRHLWLQPIGGGQRLALLRAATLSRLRQPRNRSLPLRATSQAAAAAVVMIRRS